MASYLITGSSRGLGLAMVSHLLTKPAGEVGTIFATARSDNPANLQQVIEAAAGRVKFVKLDVTDKASVQAAVSAVENLLGGKGLDVLVNNAGIMNWTQGGILAM